MSFKYFICMDFEATCWAETFKSFNTDAEIIEFPAVLLNARSGSIEAEFSYYVRPTQFPVLSDHCKEFSGISQADVDEARPLNEILQQFDDWLERLAREKDLVLFDCNGRKQNVAIVTWTDYDIGFFLKGDCQKKSIELPKYFKQRIDAQVHVKNWRQNQRNLNFKHALELVGLQQQGRSHSGIDDSRNLSRLIFKLIQKGHQLYLTNFD